MSFILDALRKSETERQREAAPTLTRAALAPARRRTPVWTWVIIGALSLALLALGSASWLGSRDANRPPAATTPQVQTVETDAGAATAPVTVPRDPNAPPRAISDLKNLNPSLPDYDLSFIAYSADTAAQNSAWINGRRYYSGDSIGNGVSLSEVRLDSVILAYTGERFLLRP